MDYPELKKRLLRLDTACLCDADKSIRVISCAIRPLSRTGKTGKMIGIAATVSVKNDFLTVIKALQEARKEEVLVIDGQGGEKALAGELFANEAKRRGLSGLVVDGAVRDTSSIESLGLPVYARLVNPMAGTVATIQKRNCEIDCGGVKVRPGDIIVGDQDGIVVASLEELIRIIPIAEQLQAQEEAVLAKIQEGQNLIAMLNFEDHFKNIEANRESKLTFT